MGVRCIFNLILNDLKYIQVTIKLCYYSNFGPANSSSLCVIFSFSLG